jgi:hypothetical protein
MTRVGPVYMAFNRNRGMVKPRGDRAAANTIARSRWIAILRKQADNYPNAFRSAPNFLRQGRGEQPGKGVNEDRGGNLSMREVLMEELIEIGMLGD